MGQIPLLTRGKNHKLNRSIAQLKTLTVLASRTSKNIMLTELAHLTITNKIIIHYFDTKSENSGFLKKYQFP